MRHNLDTANQKGGNFTAYRYKELKRTLIFLWFVLDQDHQRCRRARHRSQEVLTMMTRMRSCPRLASGDDFGIRPVSRLGHQGHKAPCAQAHGSSTFPVQL